jgi:hypothetical protein
VVVTDFIDLALVHFLGLEDSCDTVCDWDARLL